MNKLLIALVLTTAGMSAAQAQNTYQANLFRSDACTVVGRRAAEAWQYRSKGIPYPYAEMKDDAFKAMELWAIHFATTTAPSKNDAIRHSVAMCFDNVDEVFRAERGGTRLQESDLR